MTRQPNPPIRRAARAFRRIGAPGERDRDRGASPVELAILLPTMLVLLIVSIQAAAYFLARTVALNAAQIAVNSTRTFDGGTESQGEADGRKFLADAPAWLSSYWVEVTKDTANGQVTATVGGAALTLLPGVTVSVRQTARGPIERFVPAG